MSVQFDSANRPSEDVTGTSNINSTDLVADELYSLLDEGGVARAIQKVRTSWNETLDSFG